MRTKKVAALIVAAALMLSGGSSTADAAFDKSELKCRKGIAKGFLKAAAAADKVSTGCHKDRHSGKVLPGVDCNDLGPEPSSPGAADSKGKFAKAQQKLIDTPAKKCAGLDADLTAEFVSCPEPCNSELALPTNPMTTLDEATRCLACWAGELVAVANTARLGNPDPSLMSKQDKGCAQAIGKGYAKYLSTILKTRTKCQDTADKGGAMALDSNCKSAADPDGKGKIAKGLSKAEDGLDKKCGAGVTLANVGSCATTDLNDLKSCLAAETELGQAGLFPAHYELGSTVCPVAMDSTLLAGVGEDLSTSATNLEAGWNGIGHNQDLVDQPQLSAALTCPGSEPPCGSCTIDGLDPAGPQYDMFARCREDFRVPCSNPFGIDASCPGAQQCAYLTGPPLPASASNVPICIIPILASDLSGTIDPDTGSTEQILDVQAVVYSGINLTKPCPICQDDATPQDGVKNGTCSGGLNDGQPCDIQGFNSTFTLGDGVSLDCPPATDTNISGTGLVLTIPLTTSSVSLPFGTPCDFPLGGVACACAMCSGDTTLSCNSNADCAGVGAGTCTSNGGGANRVPNGCSNIASCTATVGNKAECPLGVGDDIVEYCDQEVRANGKGLLTCDTNADCDIVSSICGNGTPGSCGQCTLQETRACFVDPIVATGVADVSNPTLVSAFCVPPTVSSGANGATGLPGPSRATIESLTHFRY